MSFQGQEVSELVIEAKQRAIRSPILAMILVQSMLRRKTLILIREAGFELDFNDIKIEPLLPAQFMQAPNIDEFLAKLPEIDDFYRARVSAAASRNAVLRYVSTITPTSAALSLKAFDSSSPFWNLSGTENLVAFTTERYSQNPLVVPRPWCRRRGDRWRRVCR